MVMTDENDRVLVLTKDQFYTVMFALSFIRLELRHEGDEQIKDHMQNIDDILDAQMFAGKLS
jgi:hypothetical protein